jgi:hypothetical protein
MLSCKETTALASHRLDGKLPLSMRIKMWMHLLICVYCRDYAKQLKTVVAVIARYTHQSLNNDKINKQTEILIKADRDINKR